MHMGNNVKQNITLSLEHTIIKAAKLFAARRGTSVSALLADELHNKIARERQYERSRQAALALLEQSFALGGQHLTSRESLHERTALHR